MQWYDFALYGAFASIIGPVFFPAEDPSTALLAAFAPYGTALIIRPVDAVLFGRIADLRGRRAVFVPIIVLMAGATAAVGFLPGYAVIGVLAPITLLLRAIQGLAAGGVTVSRFDVAPGQYVSLVACLALNALRRWPETAFRATV